MHYNNNNNNKHTHNLTGTNDDNNKQITDIKYKYDRVGAREIKKNKNYNKSKQAKGEMRKS